MHSMKHAGVDRSHRVGDKQPMAVLTPFELADAQKHGRSFGLSVVSVEPLQAGSVNSNFRLLDEDGRVYFARLYEEQDANGASAEGQLLRGLARAGVPTVPPLDPIAGSPAAQFHAGKPLAIFPWVEGRDLCLGMITPDRTRRLGQALAKVHTATTTLAEIPSGRFGLDGIRSRLDFIEAQGERYRDDVRHIRQRLAHYESVRDELLPHGVMHGDLFRDNVLWQGEAISALLDFESASDGAFVYDIAVCILSWCYGDHFEMDNARALIRGYESVRPLTEAERAGAVVEGAIACLRFATTRITDFDMRAPSGRPPVRDFRRFLSRLSEIESGAFDSLFQTSQQGQAS